MAQVVVVGSGLGGLASAVRLAKSGHEVTVIEQRDRLGGVAAFIEKDGFRWSAGPHDTTMPAVLRDLFRKSGRALEKELGEDLVPRALLREHRFADGTCLALPAGSRADQIDAVTEAINTRAGNQWADYVHSHAETWDLLRRDFLERPYSANASAQAATDLLTSRLTMHRATRKRFADSKLTTLAQHHLVQSGQTARNTPAWYGVIDYLEQTFGTWTFPRGFGQVVELLEARLATRGVRVLTSTTVEDLVIENRKVVAVTTTEGSVDADHVVVAIDPRRLPSLASFAQRTTPAMPGVVTYLGLTDLPEHLAGLPHEIVFHDDYVLRVHTDDHATADPDQPDNPTASVVGHHHDRTRAGWTIHGRGRISEDVVTALVRKGIDVRPYISVRIDQSPRQFVENYHSTGWGSLWQGKDTLEHRLGPTTPIGGVVIAGSHTGGGGQVAFAGLSGAVASQLIEA